MEKFKEWKCIQCNEIFKTRLLLQNHKRVIHNVSRSKKGGWKCSKCNEILKTRVSLKTHKRLSHGIITTIGYQEQETKLYKCKFCNREKLTKISGNTFHENSCKLNINREERIGRKHLIETKQKISNGMILAHKEGRACEWTRSISHFNKSYAEQMFEKIILNEFTDKDYKTELHCGRYWIDFAWTHKMFAIEIDGKQHLESKAKEHDLERDLFLTEQGWTIIRILWTDFFNNTAFYISSLNDAINKAEISSQLKVSLESAYRIKEENLLRREEMIKKGQIDSIGRVSKSILSSSTIESKIKALLDSDIDFTKWGWVVKTSRILGVSSTQVTKFMKKNMKDFYENKCFHRRREIR